MNQNKKGETIDYGKFFEEKKPISAVTPEERKRFSLGLRTFWLTADKRSKIEIALFSIVLVSTAVVLAFYLFQPKAKSHKGPIIPLPPGEEEMLGD